MLRLLCFFGMHKWHPTARVADGSRFSKEVCTRCLKRLWREEKR